MRLVGLVAAVISAIAVGQNRPQAQAAQRPNFNGTWILQHVAIDPRMRTGSGPDFIAGAVMLVQQDGTSLAITQAKPRVHPRFTLRLDGSDSHNVLPNPTTAGPATSEFVSRVLWERDSLVIQNLQPWIFSTRWSLTTSGQLSIQASEPNIEVNPATTHLLYSRQ